MQKLGVYKLYDDVTVPEYATTSSACFDLCAYLTNGIVIDFFEPNKKKMN